jgi:dihydroorotase
VVEHASTEKMIETVKSFSPNVAATLTLHHATITYDDVCDFDDKVIDSFNYCKPIAKISSDKEAVIAAMTSGNPKFFLGSDSAPHPIEKKQSDTPPAGIFTAPMVLPALCEIFDREEKLDRFENFVSVFGTEFYGLPQNEDVITLDKKDWTIPEMAGNVKVFRGGETLSWKIAD